MVNTILMQQMKKIKRYFCQRNYNKKINQLINIKRPIRVVFISLENQKWGYQDLYEILDKDPKFEPMVLVCLHKDIYIEKRKVQPNTEETYNFYKNLGLKVDYLYKNGNYLDLKKFKPDIVFYEQPWGLCKQYRPNNVSKYALTMYSPYSIPMLDNTGNYNEHFHFYLYKLFADSQITVDRFTAYNKEYSKNCYIVNYAKLDNYLNQNKIDIEKYWKEPRKKKIIYAPHHSFSEKSLKMGTFAKNGKTILDLAKNHPDTTWIFKPHPDFKRSVIEEGILTKAEAEEYFKEWEKIGKIYLKGNYFDIFKTSDMLITDCCSFLGEYLPTEKPVIRLTRSDSKPLNKLGERVVDGYYQAATVDELCFWFEKLLNSNNDAKLQIRKNTIPQLLNKKVKGSTRIYNFIKSELRILDRE